ncbi:glycolate oxidase subunit GlcF [uncultured Candidatus Puniceispirillum sp.]|uniref:glycolate oxidase subunit GlcF n=1 Tax=uncultured Candidatus Puniceispirillum sp. TaxID=1985115 RepID=UPI002A70C2C8|nr:glycolate oxidase subunit GlcF [Candidatus Puniceispirillum sp.]
MQTHFSPEQLSDPKIKDANDILRKCVHCGFCTATCPTFVETGDERDSPRGRIWLMRELLESPQTVSEDTRYHLDRCLGCQSCMTTCPSGVDYIHLLEIGREKMDLVAPRGLGDKLMRRMLGMVIPYAGRFHMMMRFASLGRLFAPFLPRQLQAALNKLPQTLPELDMIGSQNKIFSAHKSQPIMRVVLLAGCAQRALDPAINQSTIRVLNQLGVEVVVRAEAHCCGALTQHIGETDFAHKTIRLAIDAWYEEINDQGVDAIIANASGCGTMVKDYGHVMADDPAYAAKARHVSALCKDISEIINDIGIDDIITPIKDGARPVIAYHSACSLQHGQKIHDLPQNLLRHAGFDVRQPVNGHLCCGSAGVYNILQPDMADSLKARKKDSLVNTGADYVAAGNIGCIAQLDDTALPVRHTVQFIDWASGGPKP